MNVKVVKHTWLLRILALFLGRWHFDEHEGIKLCYVVFRGTIYLVYTERV